MISNGLNSEASQKRDSWCKITKVCPNLENPKIGKFPFWVCNKVNSSNEVLVLVLRYAVYTTRLLYSISLLCTGLLYSSPTN
jgi:hypothetical protein